MGIKCPKFHHENPDDTLYCGKCTTPLKPLEELSPTKTLETPKEELTTGSTFAGRYQIIKELGKGGMRKVLVKIKYSIIFSIILYLSVFGACKKGAPTGPDMDLSLEFGGTITSGGQPFSGVDVYLSWSASNKTTTGSDGKFSFKNLLSGNYVITPSKHGYTFNPSNYELGSQTRTDLNFTTGPVITGSEVNDIATNFTAKDQNNQNVSLYDYHGKVILMDFAADWCGPCREKAETAEQFYQNYKDKGFMYVLIVIEGNPDIWAATYGLTFPVLNDNIRSIYNIYRKTSIPLPHVLDRNCTIIYKKEGWNKSEVEELINKYL